MTDKELDELQALCDAATEGPWESWRDRPPGEGVSSHRVTVCEKLVCSTHTSGVRDAVFIASARTALPRLIARVRELEALRHEWEQRRGLGYQLESRILALSAENERLRAAIADAVETILMLNLKPLDGHSRNKLLKQALGMLQDALGVIDVESERGDDHNGD